MNYIELYAIIANYYPIGISDLDPNYNDYPGINKFLSISKTKFNSDNYEGKWKNFIISIKNEFSEVSEISWDSPLADWCYTGKLTIERKGKGDLTHIRELIINVSFLAPVYTIYGVDRIESFDNENLMEFNPIITISPLGVYAPFFHSLRKKFEAENLGYNFIPFKLLVEKVKDLYVPGALDEPNASIYQGLFKLHDITSFPHKGDLLYE